MQTRFEIQNVNFKELSSDLIDNGITFMTYQGGLKMIIVEESSRTEEKLHAILNKYKEQDADIVKSLLKGNKRFRMEEQPYK